MWKEFTQKDVPACFIICYKWDANLAWLLVTKSIERNIKQGKCLCDRSNSTVQERPSHAWDEAWGKLLLWVPYWEPWVIEWYSVKQESMPTWQQASFHGKKTRKDRGLPSWILDFTRREVGKNTLKSHWFMGETRNGVDIECTQEMSLRRMHKCQSGRDFDYFL